jgi:hypothetical protein
MALGTVSLEKALEAFRWAVSRCTFAPANERWRVSGGRQIRRHPPVRRERANDAR